MRDQYRVMPQPLTNDFVALLPGVAVKWGHPYLVDQAKIMQKIRESGLGHGGSEIVPSVYHVMHDGYVMERLQEPLFRPMVMTRKAIELLYVYVWSKLEVDFLDAPDFSRAALLNYVAIQDSALKDFVPSEKALERYSPAAAKQMTHGDCTFENMMSRTGRDLVFIDWAPYRREYIPAHRDVDIGKIMQSLYKVWKETQDELYRSRLMHLHGEFPLSWFWCAMHYQRILVRAEHMPGMRVFAEQAVKDLITLGGK